jgi:hypothetical protein
MMVFFIDKRKMPMVLKECDSLLLQRS